MENLQPANESRITPQQQQEQPMEEEEDVVVVDDTPDFLNPGDDAIEVQVDDDNDDMPMEDEEEDDEDVENDAATDDAAVVVDMSRVQLDTHTGPVYAVATHWDAASQKLVIVSAGGDDKSFLHQLVSPSSSGDGTSDDDHLASTTSTMPPPLSTSSVVSIPLEYAHTDSVSCAALNFPYISNNVSSPQKTPRLVAVGGYDGAIVVYTLDDDNNNTNDNNNIDENQLRPTVVLEGPSDVEWLCFHPRGGTVLLAGSATDGTVWMYHVPLQKCLQVFVGHESAVTAGAFSPDGRWALTGSADGTLRIWAPKTGMCKHLFRFGSSHNDNAGLTCMGTHGGVDGQLVMVGSENGQAHVCHIGTKKVVASLRHFEMPQSFTQDDEIELPASVEAVAFATAAVNANWCATGGVDGVLKVWDLANNGQCRQICKPENDSNGDENTTGGITRIQWHPTLPLVFATYTSGVVRLWDARNGQLVHTLTGSSEVLNDLSVQWVDGGKSAIIVTASDDGKVRAFEMYVSSMLDAASGTASSLPS